MASIEQLKGSDGTGNANLATIQSTRLSGATTIDVDTVLGINPAGFSASMGTPHTFTDPITSEEITVISDATAVDFTGHVDGSNLEIDDIAPGYTDAGSAVGDIVIIKPTTQYADNLAAILEVVHDDDGSLKDDSVGAGVIADNAIDSEALFTDNVDPVKRASELIFDHVASGCLLTGTGYASTLGWSLSSGVVYINGKRLTYAGGTGNVTATKDTYFDLLDNSDGTAVLVNTGGNVVTVNAASPALAANSVRVGIIQSGANIADVAHINQGEITKLLPIASSIPYQTTDSLGNLICPRDPNRRKLGERRIIASITGQSTSVADVDQTGLSISIIAPGNRDVKISAVGSDYDQSGGIGTVYGIIKIKEGATALKSWNVVPSTANFPSGFAPWVITRPSAGLHTYKIAVANNGTGPTFGVGATSTDPCSILVEME